MKTMKKWNINQKPSLTVCPEQYCFFWVPSGGSADLSGATYDSFEEAVEAAKQGQVFSDGGCSCSFANPTDQC